MDIKKLPQYFAIALLIFLVSFFYFVGFSWWLIIVLILWALFYMIFVTQKLVFKLIPSAVNFIWMVFVVLLIFSFGSIYCFKNGGGNKTATKAKKTLTSEQCAPIYEKYNGKIINFTSDVLKGRAAVRITDKNTCKSVVTYQYLFKANLEKNDILGNRYMGYTTEKDSKENRKSWYGNGSITPVYDAAQKEVLPSDPFKMGSYLFYTSGNQEEATDTFAASYTEEPVFVEDEYKEIVGENKIYIIDGREYIKKTEAGDGGFTTEADEDTAAQKSKIIKVFEIKFSE